MDANDWLWIAQLTAGSKRPSPSPVAAEREDKRSRTQPRDNNPDHDILDSELSLPLYETSFSPSQNLYCGYGNQYDDGSRSQPDTSMGYSPIYNSPTPSRAFGETPPFTDFSSLEDLRESNSQVHVITPYVRSGIDIC
jgi:hypothetical protein